MFYVQSDHHTEGRTPMVGQSHHLQGRQNWFQAVRCKVHIIIRTQLNEQIAITTADSGQTRGAERENTNGEFVSPARKPGPIIWDIFSSGGCQQDNFHGRQIQ